MRVYSTTRSISLKNHPSFSCLSSSTCLSLANFSSKIQINRMASSSSPSHNTNVYETSSSLIQYLMLHFPSSGADEGIPSILPHANAPQHGLRFPHRAAKATIDLYDMVNQQSQKTDPLHALDVGCAVGGGSFELAKHFQTVDAFDLSENFIRVARQMKDMERVTFQVPMEGDITAIVVCRHEPDVTSEVANRVRFFVGDACRIPEMMNVRDGNIKPPLLAANKYDAIVLSNLLCRLPDPTACLEALPLLLTDKGVVLILTPYSWLNEFTPPDKWLGGHYDDEVDSFAAASDTNTDAAAAVSKRRQKIEQLSRNGLQREMERLGFVNVSCEEMPVVIREHQRKYQYIISEATGWKRKR
jgi:SAM-dependent methyltransferase